jgi:HEAT repeat protein
MPLILKPREPSAQLAPQTGDGLASLASPDEDLRWTAARAAPDIPGSAAPLAAALRKEASPRVREAMFTSLARMGDTAAAVQTLPLLRSDDANLRAGALDALRIMIGNTRELLPPLLQDADVDVRVLSCELVRTLAGGEATALLCEVLQRESDPNVCAAALDVLAEVGQSEALPVLAACALRFQDTPFLAFAFQVTADRINGHSPRNRD